MNNFWIKLKKPVFCLAPMADVTDCAFRQIIAKYGRPDIFWTEFVSADGLAHLKGREKLLIDLKYSKNEHPIVAQLFGSNPDNIYMTSKLCKELGFDGIDINMGCPDKTIEKQGAGAGMIKNLKLAKEIIQSAKKGGGDLPISVKTRIGYNKDETETWIKGLLEEDLDALTIHLRTRKEMSDVPAQWEKIPRIVELRDQISPRTLIIGNGDALDLKDAKEKAKKFGCDGVMLGRAIFGNPWLFEGLNSKKISGPAPFSDYRVGPSGKEIFLNLRPIDEKLNVLVEHTKLFEKLLGKVKSFNIMKKHYKAYVSGWDGAKELRMKLMDAKNAKEVEKIVNDFLNQK